MGKTLAEYAAANPMPGQPTGEREAMAAAAKTMQERAEERETAEQLKSGIMRQLEQGNAPHIILYTALKCIGLYSNDPEYTKAATGLLDAVYADLAQQSFIQDNAAIAAERLERQQAEFNKQLSSSLKRQLAKYRRIEKALTDALNEVSGIEDDKPILTD